MSLLTLVVVLVVVGVILWLVNAYVPMQAEIKRLLNIAVVVFLVIWILYSIFGNSFPDIHIGG